MKHTIILQYVYQIEEALKDAKGPGVPDASRGAREIGEWAEGKRPADKAKFMFHELEANLEAIRAVVDTIEGVGIPGARRAVYKLEQWAIKAGEEARQRNINATSRILHG